MGWFIREAFPTKLSTGYSMENIIKKKQVAIIASKQSTGKQQILTSY